MTFLFQVTTTAVYWGIFIGYVASTQAPLAIYLINGNTSL